MIRKEYEKPSVEIIKFNVNDSIMTNQASGDIGIGGDGMGTGESVQDGW